MSAFASQQSLVEHAVLSKAQQLRSARNQKIKHAMHLRDAAATRLLAARAEVGKAEAEQTAAETHLATLLEKGERKVIHNSLVTVNQDGGLRIEPIEVLSLL